MSTIRGHLEPERTNSDSQQRPATRPSAGDRLATTRQVVRACVRCRKQKSRCDAFRPCSVCIKAGGECTNRPDNDKPDIATNNHTARATFAHPTEVRPTKVRRLSTHTTGDREESQPASMNYDTLRTPFSEGQAHTPDENIGAMDLTEENMNTQLFTLTRGHLMDTPDLTPQHRAHDADSVHLQPHLVNGNESMSSPSTSSIIDPQYRAVLPWSYSRASAASLLANLPPRPVADYLVAVYFNTVHWFMVILHEGHFLHHYRTMMDLYEQDALAISNTDEDFTFAVLMLTVITLGGRYTSIHTARARRCKQTYMEFRRTSRPYEAPSMDAQDFDVVKTMSQLFSVVRSNTTDNLACGTIATIQSLLLLGSLYLFHGDANLAWSNSGCMIRTAQALGLHKEHSELRWNSRYYQAMDRVERRQLRWRLFWAVYTGDRFLAMCYGLPLLISDEDCVAGVPCEDNIYPPPGSSSFLMIEDDIHDISPASLSNSSERPITLLTYQTYKLQFYIILGQITSTLYRQPQGGLDIHTSKFEGPTNMKCKYSLQMKTDELIKAVQRLEHKLRKWFQDLPKALRLAENLTYPACNEPVNNDDDEIIIPAYDDVHKNTSQVKKRRSKIKTAIYGLQALLLQLAYDNALILIHRPILALKNKSPLTPSQHIFRQSINCCWEATLRISDIGNHHIFNRNQQAHAISYVGIHLFTAGAVLSAFASSKPLSRRAWEARQALSRVIKMQRQLRRKVVVSGQGLNILETLAREVVNKEIKVIISQEDDTLEDNDQTMPSENAQPKAFLTNDLVSTRTSSQVTNLSSQSQQYLSPTADTSVNYTEGSAAFPLDINEDIENDFSNNLMLDLNESMLDIDKFLSESQFLPASETGMDVGGSGTNSEPQQTGIWWFAYDQ